MEKYANKRMLRREGGRFAKPPTLEAMGLPLAKGERKCGSCGYRCFPILEAWKCPECGHQLPPNTRIERLDGRAEEP